MKIQAKKKRPAPKSTTSARRHVKRSSRAKSSAQSSSKSPAHDVQTIKPSPAASVPSPSVVHLAVGQPAPQFSLPGSDGKTIRLSDFRGRKVVLYFYPKDDTPGCTKEACAFRDGIEEVRDCDAVVLGISPDSVESHKKFSHKFDLNFPLLSDVDKRVAQAYGVWKEKTLYGRKFMGIERTTFLIDESGKISEIFSKVKVDGHLEEVLGELELMKR